MREAFFFHVAKGPEVCLLAEHTGTTVTRGIPRGLWLCARPPNVPLAALPSSPLVAGFREENCPAAFRGIPLAARGGGVPLEVICSSWMNTELSWLKSRCEASPCAGCVCSRTSKDAVGTSGSGSFVFVNHDLGRLRSEFLRSAESTSSLLPCLVPDSKSGDD